MIRAELSGKKVASHYQFHMVAYVLEYRGLKVPKMHLSLVEKSLKEVCKAG